MALLENIPRVAVIDFETTQSEFGLRAVEVAVILVTRGTVARRFAELVNPGCPIDRHSQRVHGITDEDVADARAFGQVWRNLRPLLSGSIVVAHNAPFDSSVLRNELQDYRFEPPCMEWWCSLRFARKIWPGRFKHYGLAHLVRHMNLAQRVPHRAAGDAQLALKLLKKELATACRQKQALEDVRDMARHRGVVSWPWNSG